MQTTNGSHPEELSHPIYKRVPESEADACAWVYISRDKFEKYYYKHPELGPHEVRARNLYASLCMSDSHTGRGKWGECLYPLAPGHEVASEVIAVGSEVKSVKVGDLVLFGPLRDSCKSCEYCNEGSTNMCLKTEGSEKFLYGKYWGGYSTHIQQPESHCHLLPQGINLKTVAPLMCAGVTVFSPLNRHCKKGYRVGVIGTGGLGHLAIQFASKMGMTVDAFTYSSDPEKSKLFHSLGATNIVNWKDDELLKKLENTYDALVNTIPVGLTVEKMDLVLSTLKPRSKFLNLTVPEVSEKLIASYFTIVLKELQIIGSVVGGRRDTDEMLEFSAKHHVEPICEFYDFNDFDKALDKLENGTPKFRCVVEIDNHSKKFQKN